MFKSGANESIPGFPFAEAASNLLRTQDGRGVVVRGATTHGRELESNRGAIDDVPEAILDAQPILEEDPMPCTVSKTTYAPKSTPRPSYDSGRTISCNNDLTRWRLSGIRRARTT